ncbi:MAG: PorP/SprF family type IX secretion system membrane protein [Bacteroidia bacterium]|nr:PorP/SprF family type IX secretion system membrane protein [Bacteroidia bacterium]
MRFLRFYFGSILFFILMAFKAQDMYFAQIDANRIYFNPAATGMIDGHFRATALHRQQWTGMQKGFITSYASLEIPFYDRIDKINKAGLGGYFFQDVAGFSKFKTTQLAISAAGIVEIGPSHFLSGGIGAAFIQRNYDLSAIQWVNQYDGKNYNPALPHYENFYLPNVYVFDVTIGARYEHHFARRTFRKVSFKYFAIDASLSHVTGPNLMYSVQTEESYKRRLSAGLQYIYDFNRSKFGINLFYQFMKQGNFQLMQGGILLRRRISEQSQITGIRNYKVFSAGFMYRHTGSIVPNIRFKISDFELGLAYDAFIGVQKYGAKGFSAFEVLLSYERTRKNF